MDHIRTLNFWVSKDTISKVKRQLIEWEKIFASHISNKELISRLDKELLTIQQQHQKKKNGQKAWTDISPKKIHKWSISTWEDAQYH